MRRAFSAMKSPAIPRPSNSPFSDTAAPKKMGSPESTPEIEKKFVHQVYDAIAPHFSATRFSRWPKVAAFLSSLQPGSIVLDSGCGNGKYLGSNSSCFFLGCDISSPLVNICAFKGHDVLVADALNLPFKSGFCDAAISIAVLHHLSSELRRKKAVEEMIRVVRKKGRVLITVWAKEQEDQSLLAKWTPVEPATEDQWVNAGAPVQGRSPRAEPMERIPEEVGPSDDDLDAQEYFVPWHVPYHRAEVNVAAAEGNGALGRRDDKKSAVVYNRYYHVFKEGELQRLVSGIKDAVIAEEFYDKSNWCIVLEKM